MDSKVYHAGQIANLRELAIEKVGEAVLNRSVNRFSDASPDRFAMGQDCLALARSGAKALRLLDAAEDAISVIGKGLA